MLCNYASDVVPVIPDCWDNLYQDNPHVHITPPDNPHLEITYPDMTQPFTSANNGLNDLHELYINNTEWYEVTICYSGLIGFDFLW